MLKNRIISKNKYKIAYKLSSLAYFFQKPDLCKPLDLTKLYGELDVMELPVDYYEKYRDNLFSLPLRCGLCKAH